MNPTDANYFTSWLARKQREHGAKWDPSELAPQFIPYFHSDTRVKVAHPIFGVRTGTIGVTSGWRPAFLLMRRSSAHGSSDVLGPDDKLIAVQHGRVYRDVVETGGV